MVLWTQNPFVCKRSQLKNALRGYLVEYRIVVGQGMVQFRRMIATIDEGAAKLPNPIHTLRQAYIEQISVFDERIKALDHEITRRTKSDQATMWLLTISGFWARACDNHSSLCAANGRRFQPARICRLVRECPKANTNRWAGHKAIIDHRHSLHTMARAHTISVRGTHLQYRMSVAKKVNISDTVYPTVFLLWVIRR
jgi:hypothetical protein